MDYLLGEVEHQLDAKNRIRIPAKYRSKFDQCYFVALNDCIGVYSKAGVDKILEHIVTVSTADPERFDARSIMVSSIGEVKEDEQGRTVLSAFFRAHASIVKDIVTVGMIDHLEIWAKEVRDAKKSNMSPTRAAILLGI